MRCLIKGRRLTERVCLKEGEELTDEEIEALQAELESTKAELADLKAEKETLRVESATLASELETKEARITELEQAVTEANEKLTNISNALSQAVTSYKAMVVQANPDVPEELITGDTIEAIDQSLENAKALISKVREGIGVEVAAGRVPAGAPPRTPLDLSVLSPREKIRYAIGGK